MKWLMLSGGSRENDLPTDSIALCYQVRTLDKSRLEDDLGELSDTSVRPHIREALRFQLEL